MKFTKRISWFVFILAMIAFAMPAFAQAPRGPRPGIKQKSQVNTKWEHKADKNRDGHVGPKEGKMYQSNHPNKNNPKVDRKWEFQADTNRDGVVDPKEGKMYKSHHPNADKNNDGTVDWKDHKTAQGRQHKPHLKDVNGDGKIDNLDRKIMIESDVNDPHEARMDTDHSGFVTKDELDAAKKILSE